MSSEQRGAQLSGTRLERLHKRVCRLVFAVGGNREIGDVQDRTVLHASRNACDLTVA
ncbi:MAG: hypothetical protein JOY87_01875 [Candidatus Eremiobacteraeota bacterium]|nr:hypothetical protein [Candidatus Eremiobacteraeota bacterium]